MAARPGAPACQAPLCGALTDWFLARQYVCKREEGEMESRPRRVERERERDEVERLC